MTNLFKQPKAPDPIPPANSQEAQARGDNSRSKRAQKGGTNSTLFTDAAPITTQAPKSTLFGGGGR